MKTPPIILSVAGSDPSGGAGIQADIKTISALGGYAATAVTALTIQNTQGVQRVNYLPPVIVADQVKAVLADLDVAAVKIGMMGKYDIIKAVSCILIKRREIPIVFDPVMLATSGHSLADKKSVEGMKLFLLPQCQLATPNLNEASMLIGEKIRTVDEMKQAAMALHRQYNCAFLIKGGHLDGEEMTDVLFDGELHIFTSPRIETKNLHGTGCTLSSAIATYLGMGCGLVDAVTQAKEYLNRAMVSASHLTIGKGNGPVWHLAEFYPY